MDWLKSQWASWKVKVSVVGGVLVVATAYGTCEVDPGEVSSNTTEATEEVVTETIEVSATTVTTESGADEVTTTATDETVESEVANTGDGTTTTETTTE